MKLAVENIVILQKICQKLTSNHTSNDLKIKHLLLVLERE
jgi:hypothetical protein